MTLSLGLAIQMAGIVQLGMAALALLVPRILRFRERLAALEPALRTLMRVYGAFMALVAFGMAVLSLAVPAHLTDGSVLGISICAFLAVFWAARLGVQLFIYDVGALAPTGGLRAGYYALTACFVYLSATFSLATIAGAAAP